MKMEGVYLIDVMVREAGETYDEDTPTLIALTTDGIPATALTRARVKSLLDIMGDTLGDFVEGLTVGEEDYETEEELAERLERERQTSIPSTLSPQGTTEDAEEQQTQEPKEVRRCRTSPGNTRWSSE